MCITLSGYYLRPRISGWWGGFGGRNLSSIIRWLFFLRPWNAFERRIFIEITQKRLENDVPDGISKVGSFQVVRPGAMIMVLPEK